MSDNKLLNVEIITPEKVIYAGKAASVRVPGSKSSFQVLYNHAPIVASLEPGTTRIVDGSSKEIFYSTSSGFVEVLNNHISILVESAEEAKS